jgi:TldD protein
MLRRGPEGAYSDVRFERREIAELHLDESGLRSTTHEKSGGCLRVCAPEGTRRLIFADTDDVPAARNESEPRTLEQTAERLKHCHRLMRSVSAVRAAQILFREDRVRKWHQDSLGHSRAQRQHAVFVLLTLVLHNGQLVTEVLSGGPQFDLADELSRVEETLRFAEAVAAGERVAPGQHDVVLAPQLAGSIIHETVGHICEADNEDRSRSIRTHFQIGSEVAASPLSVVDDPTLPGLPGSYDYDDEGTPAERTVLIREGTLCGKLHNLRTAQKAGVRSNGHGRASSFAAEPIVRCSNTMVLPGSQTVEQLIAETPRGVFLRGVGGGMTYGDTFSYRVCGGWNIENGRLTSPVANLTIRGKVSEFLRNVRGVGDRIPPLGSPFCIKRGQAWMPVWSGSPAMAVRGVTLHA